VRQFALLSASELRLQQLDTANWQRLDRLPMRIFYLTRLSGPDQRLDPILGLIPSTSLGSLDIEGIRDVLSYA